MNPYTDYEAIIEKVRSGVWRYRGFTIERVGEITNPPYFWLITGITHKRFAQLGDARRYIDQAEGGVE